MNHRDDHFLTVEEQRSLDQSSSEEFDRVAFTMQLLRLLRPPMTVAVYPRLRELEVQTGRDLSRDGDGVWAMLGVPANASREHIALAVAGLAGVPRPSLLLDLVMGAHARTTPPALD